MNKYRRLSEKQDSKEMKQVFGCIADSYEKNKSGVKDALSKPLAHKSADIRNIQEWQYQQVLANSIEDNADTQTLSQVRKGITDSLAPIRSAIKDGFFNPVTNINTELDPNFYSQADIPISLSPYEATSFYSSGGIPQDIIDKKAYGLFTNGFGFKGEGWTEDECEEFKGYCETLEFEKHIGNGVRDSLVYGGGLVVPAMEDDTFHTYGMNLKALLANKKLRKGSVKYLWNADRWNSVLVPDYNISASDYLMPRSFYVPITGLDVATERMAVIRTKVLPYWGTLRQMGWGVSDMVSWIKSLLSYEILVNTIPIMAQQMSLIYFKLPQDGLIAQNGIAVAQELARFNSGEMNKASNINIKTINAVGEVVTVNRTYTGFSELVTILRQDIAAKCGFPESVLFHTQPTGFSDNQEDTTLKQAETIQRIATSVAPQLKPLMKILVASCFGEDSDQFKRADRLNICFESPIVLTNEEKTEQGKVFFEMLNNGTSAGLPLDISIEIAKQFVPDIEIDDSIIDRMKQEPLAEGEDPTEQGSSVEEFVNGNHSEGSAVNEFVQGKDETESEVANFVNGGSKDPAFQFIKGK